MCNPEYRGHIERKIVAVGSWQCGIKSIVNRIHYIYRPWLSSPLFYIRLLCTLSTKCTRNTLHVARLMLEKDVDLSCVYFLHSHLHIYTKSYFLFFIFSALSVCVFLSVSLHLDCGLWTMANTLPASALALALDKWLEKRIWQGKEVWNLSVPSYLI